MATNRSFSTRDISMPRDGYEIKTNYWWMLIDGDKTKALFFGDSAQCNKNQSVVAQLKSGEMWQSYSQNIKVIFVPVAYIPPRKY